MNRVILPVLLVLALAACQEVSNESGDSITATTLQYNDGSDVKGDTSGIVGKRLQVVSDSSEFASLWDEHVAAFSPMPAQPAVDFGNRMVVAAFSGQRRSTGYEVTIGEVTEFDEFVDVIINHESPGENCATNPVLTQPHHMVVLDATDKPVVFTEIFTRADAC